MPLLLAIQKYLKNFSLIVFIHSERKFLQQEEKSETYFFSFGETRGFRCHTQKELVHFGHHFCSGLIDFIIL